MSSLNKDNFCKICIDNKIYSVGERIGKENIYKLCRIKNDIISDSQYIIKINVGKTKKDRFDYEIELIKSLKSKYIVEIISYGEIEYRKKEEIKRYKYYVMKKYDCDFRKIISEDKTINQKLELYLKMCKTIKYIHDKNIVHRDIKPENFLYDRKNNDIVLCDFGIAKDLNGNKNLTVESEKIANSNYCAPEQRKIGNKIFGFYTDIYALGIILNELITTETGYGINYRRIFDVDASYGELDEVVNRMIEYNYEERENNINNVIFSINRIINNRRKYIYKYKISIKNNLDYSSKQINKINNIFANDCYCIKQALKKYSYKELNFYYHNNIKYEVINDDLIKLIKLRAINDRIKNKFLYESQQYDEYDDKCKKDMFNEFKEYFSKFQYEEVLGMNLLIDESLYLVRNLSYYHAEEIKNELDRVSKEIDENIKNIPICVICYEIFSNYNFYNIDNLSSDIVPMYNKSISDCENNYIIGNMNINEKGINLKKNIEKLSKNIIINIERDNIKLIFSKKSKVKFINKCKESIENDKQNIINKVYIEDMISEISDDNQLCLLLNDIQTINSLLNVFDKN